MRYGQLSTTKSVDETRRDIRETFRKWRSVQEFEILPQLNRNETSAVVEFWAQGSKRTLTCNRFYRREENIRAVYLTLEALRLADERGILRELAEAAAGFLEAPKGARVKRPWHEVLGVMPTADAAVIKAAYRATAQTAHPDAGGSEAAMAELNAAYEQAKAERGFG
ncbi:MAG TPA: J domain-containing protein [Dehalococcoidia bacterium]|nr:J domain-containing protein [Dehalococcoidia bacterium]